MVPIFASLAASVIIASGGIDPPHILPPLHLTVVATAAVERGFVERMLTEAAAIWRAAGISIQWSTAAGDRLAVRAPGITVVVHDGLTESADGNATLGWIAFAGQAMPEPTVHLCLGNALELMKRTGSAHDAHGLMRAARPSVDFFSPSRAGFDLTADQRASLTDRPWRVHAETICNQPATQLATCCETQRHEEFH